MLPVEPSMSVSGLTAMGDVKEADDYESTKGNFRTETFRSYPRV